VPVISTDAWIRRAVLYVRSDRIKGVLRHRALGRGEDVAPTRVHRAVGRKPGTAATLPPGSAGVNQLTAAEPTRV
jgi:hypothetical protein